MTQGSDCLQAPPMLPPVLQPGIFPAGLENTRRAKVRGDPPPPAEFRRVCLDTRRPPARKHDPPEHPDHCHPPHSRRGPCPTASLPSSCDPAWKTGPWEESGGSRAPQAGCGTPLARCAPASVSAGRALVEEGSLPHASSGRWSWERTQRCSWSARPPAPLSPAECRPRARLGAGGRRPGCAPHPGPAVCSCPGAGRGGDAAGPAGLGTRRRSGQKVQVSLPRAPQAGEPSFW
nr:splicing factor, proline- and glutamine-rich-like [Equus asinus]